MAFSPQETARAMLTSLKRAHDVCVYLASQQSMPVPQIVGRVDQVRSAMDAAHDALQTLQASFTNEQIKTYVERQLEPCPVDVGASYTAARNAVIAMLDDYGANVIPLLPWPYTWNATTKQHEDATYNIDTPTDFKTNIIAARDALEVFG